MPKPIIRIVSFLLTACLLSDPSFATFAKPYTPPIDSLPTFREQALTPHLVQAFRKPFDALAAGLAHLLASPKSIEENRHSSSDLIPTRQVIALVDQWLPLLFRLDKAMARLGMSFDYALNSILDWESDGKAGDRYKGKYSDVLTQAVKAYANHPNAAKVGKALELKDIHIIRHDKEDEDSGEPFHTLVFVAGNRIVTHTAFFDWLKEHTDSSGNFVEELVEVLGHENVERTTADKPAGSHEEAQRLFPRTVALERALLLSLPTIPEAIQASLSSNEANSSAIGVGQTVQYGKNICHIQSITEIEVAGQKLPKVVLKPLDTSIAPITIMGPKVFSDLKPVKVDEQHVAELDSLKGIPKGKWGRNDYEHDSEEWEKIREVEEFAARYPQMREYKREIIIKHLPMLIDVELKAIRLKIAPYIFQALLPSMHDLIPEDRFEETAKWALQLPYGRTKEQIMIDELGPNPEMHQAESLEIDNIPGARDFQKGERPLSKFDRIVCVTIRDSVKLLIDHAPKGWFEQERKLVDDAAQIAGIQAWGTLGYVLKEAGPDGSTAVRRLQNLLTLATDYNRNRIASLLYSQDHYKRLTSVGANISVHVNFYEKILRDENRLSYLILDGLFKGLKSGDVDPLLPQVEQDLIWKFVARYHTFNAPLFKIYKTVGEAELDPLFEFARAILSDAIGPEEIDSLIYKYSGYGFDGEEAILTAIQMVIPMSGASFISGDEIRMHFEQIHEAGDLRSHVPANLQNVTFQSDETDSKLRYDAVLKPGEIFDPERNIEHIVDKLRHRDIADRKKLQRQDKASLIRALRAYFKSASISTEQGVREAFYAYASHSDQLGEKIDRIRIASYDGINLLEQLFMDKDNLSTLLRPVLQGIPRSRWPTVPVSDEKPIRNPRKLAQQIEGVSRTQADDLPRLRSSITRMVSGLTLGSVERDLIPLLSNETIQTLVLDAVRSAALVRPRTEHEIIESLFEEPLKQIQAEKAKFELRETGERVLLDLKVVKGIPFGLWGLNAGVCIVRDIELWSNPKFFLGVLINRHTQEVAGFVHFFESEHNGHSVLTVPGINPSVEFLGHVKARDIYPMIEKNLVRVAQAGGYAGLYLPTDSNILSNRGDVQKEIIKRKYAEITLPNQVHWNQDPSPFPFDEVYVMWQRSPEDTATHAGAWSLNSKYLKGWAHKVETQWLIPIIAVLSFFVPMFYQQSPLSITQSAMLAGAMFMLPHRERMFNPSVAILGAGTVGVSAFAMAALHVTASSPLLGLPLLAATAISLNLLTRLHWFNNNVRPLHQALFAKAA